ncbi:MAG: aminobenzoate oxygenase, partial [Delftia sp.]|nr:aminobenzoate oxygenase [Delftia sp.]
VYTDSVQSLIDRIGLAGRNLGGSVALVSSVLEEMQA